MEKISSVPNLELQSRRKISPKNYKKLQNIWNQFQHKKLYDETDEMQPVANFNLEIIFHMALNES